MSALRRAVYFSKKALEVLKNEPLAIDHKYKRLLVIYSEHEYKSTRAKEYAINGFLRRLQTLVRCIDTVFKILPPDLTELPTRDELLDATINLQAFVFNVFGSIDNLAWIWVLEKGLTKDDGNCILDLGESQCYPIRLSASKMIRGRLARPQLTNRTLRQSRRLRLK